MERQEGGSLIWFLFIIGALWQSADLLFYAVRLQTLSRQLADNIFFCLGNVCLMGSVSEVSFESNFVVHLIWFHFIWNLAEEELWMKIPRLCTFLCTQKREKLWLHVKPIPWGLKFWCALTYFIMILYIFIYFSCFSPFIELLQIIYIGVV